MTTFKDTYGQLVYEHLKVKKTMVMVYKNLKDRENDNQELISKLFYINLDGEKQIEDSKLKIG